MPLDQAELTGTTAGWLAPVLEFTAGVKPRRTFLSQIICFKHLRDPESPADVNLQEV